MTETNEKLKPLVVISNAKTFVASECKDGGTKLRLSAEALDKLTIQIREGLKKAAETALADGRRTVLARDVPDLSTF